MGSVSGAEGTGWGTLWWFSCPPARLVFGEALPAGETINWSPIAISPSMLLKAPIRDLIGFND